MSVILFIIILGVLVISHEMGHFFVARRFNIRVDEFGFGYPPRAAKLFKKGDTEYTLNWIPFGGFVKIFGENPDEENTNGPDKARSFVHKPKWQQALVLVAGVAANFLLAWILFSICFLSGMPAALSGEENPKYVEARSVVVSNVVKDSPAESAGIMIGDKVIELSHDSEKLENPSITQISDFVSAQSTSTIDMEILRDADHKDFAITPKFDPEEGRALIGIEMKEVGILKLPFFMAFGHGFTYTVDKTAETAAALWTLIHDSFAGHADLANIAGPIGIVNIVGEAYNLGLIYLLFFTALISINLAIINLIPFPALDGGRLLFLLIEKVKGSRIKPTIANAFNTVGFFLLIALMLVVTYNDIAHLIHP